MQTKMFSVVSSPMTAKLPDLTRTAAIGTSGSGKTVFATALTATLKSQLIELDLLYLDAGRNQPSDARFIEQVTKEIEEPIWVFDGNHAAVRNHIWRRATAIIYLDYPLSTVVWRQSKRIVQNLWHNSGPSGPLWQTLFNPRSLLWWAIRSHGDRRRRYLRYFGGKNSATQ